MSTATITRIDTGKTGTDTIGTETMDWRARADRIAGEIAEAAARHDADDSFVSEGYQRLKEEGFFKALVPAELGGGGAEYAEICDAIRRIAASCGATALAFSMHSHLVAAAAWRWRHQNAPTDGLLEARRGGGSDPRLERRLRLAEERRRRDQDRGRLSDQRAQDLFERLPRRRSPGDERGV